MFCKNCGSQLADGAKFCAACGTPVGPTDPPQDLPSGPVRAPEDESPVSGGVTPPDESAEAGAVPAGSGEQAPAAGTTLLAAHENTKPSAFTVPAAVAGTAAVKRRGGVGVFAVLGIAAVAAIVLIVLAVKLIAGSGGGGNKAMYAYLNDDGELMFLADLNEKTQALEVTDDAKLYTTKVEFSLDGKTIYFTDKDSTLYAISTAELKKDGKPERIARDVYGFRVLSTGKLAYIQEDGDDVKVSIYESGESYRLYRGPNEGMFSEDPTALYYSEEDPEDGTHTLYRLPIEKNATAERILKGVSDLYTSIESDLLVYSVYNSEADSGNNITIYSCVPGGDKNKLVSNVYSITGVSVDGGKVSFYYYKEEEDERPLYDFVTDNLAGSDAAVLSEPEPVYPSWSDYSVEGIWIRDGATEYAYGVVYYYNGAGEECPIDASSLMAGHTLDDLYSMYYDLYDIAYADASERYDAAYNDCNERYDEWWKAKRREDLRVSLKEETYTQRSLSLYQYTGGEKSDPIATGLRSIGEGMPEINTFLYHKVDQTGGKVANISDLSYSGEVYDLLHSGTSAHDDWYQNVNGKESDLDLDDTISIYTTYVLNGKEVVLRGYDSEENENSLLSFTVGKEGLTFSAKIIDGAGFTYPQMAKDSSGNDVIYLFTERMENKYGTAGDFCVYRNGKLETIAPEVYSVYILDKKGTTYAVTDKDSRYNQEISLLKDGKLSVISDEVGSLNFLDDVQILYISDGDLCLWDGKSERRIAVDVEYVWSNAFVEYDSYNCW